jgi:hypothetical protein
MEDDEDEDDDPDGSGLRMLCFAAGGGPMALAGTTKYGYVWPQFVHGSRFGDYPQQSDKIQMVSQMARHL